MTFICNSGRTGRLEIELASVMANLVLIAGSFSMNQVLAANILGNPGFKTGSLTNRTSRGANNYVLPETRSRHNEQWSTDIALQSKRPGPCGFGQTY